MAAAHRTRTASATYITIVASSLLLLSGCAQAPAPAASSSAIVDAVIWCDVPEAPDTSFVGSEAFWLDNQKALADAAAAAEVGYPADYAYGYFDDDHRTLVIGFRSTAPAEVVAALEATGLPHTVEENVGFSSAEPLAV